MPGGENGVIASNSIPYRAVESGWPAATEMPLNNHGAASGSVTTYGATWPPRSLPSYWTPISADSGRPTSRQSRPRQMRPFDSTTCRKKLFAERNARLPPRSR